MTDEMKLTVTQGSEGGEFPEVNVTYRNDFANGFDFTAGFLNADTVEITFEHVLNGAVDDRFELSMTGGCFAALVATCIQMLNDYQERTGSSFDVKVEEMQSAT